MPVVITDPIPCTAVAVNLQQLRAVRFVEATAVTPSTPPPWPASTRRCPPPSTSAPKPHRARPAPASPGNPTPKPPARLCSRRYNTWAPRPVPLMPWAAQEAAQDECLQQPLHVAQIVRAGCVIFRAALATS